MNTVFNMITRELKLKHLSKRELSRRLGISQSTLQGMFKSKSIKVSRLIQFSKTLDYNFFGEIAQQLSVNNPALEQSLKLKEEEMNQVINRLNEDKNQLNENINQLTEKNKNLKVKLDVLENVVDKLSSS